MAALINPNVIAVPKVMTGASQAIKSPVLQDAKTLAAKYGGVNYETAPIEAVFQKSASAANDVSQKAYDRSSAQYANRLGQSQNSYLDAMRKSNAAAISSGASKGMQNANALSAMLGLSQQSSADNTLLTQEQRALGDKYAAAQAKATQDALQYSDTQKMALGSLGANLYGTDTQAYAAGIGGDAQIQAANAAATAAASAGANYGQGLIGSAYNQAQGTMDAADKQLSGVQTQTAGVMDYNAAMRDVQNNATRAGMINNDKAAVANMMQAGLARNPNMTLDEMIAMYRQVTDASLAK